MTSHPPGPCCVNGRLLTGETEGSIQILNGTSTYISLPPSDQNNSRAILFLSDACGMYIPNSQLLADSFAGAGYTVFMPDLFYGDPHPMNDPNADVYEWLKKHPIERVDPVVEAALQHIRKENQFEWVGAVGYCFGAKYVARWLRREEGKIDAGFVAHPSFMEPDELRSMTGPLSIAAAQTDYILTTEKRYETEQILGEMDVAWQINLYSDVEHSFAVRPDPDAKRQVWAQKEAFAQALRWFEEHLKG